MFLPVILQGIHLSHFCSISLLIFDHQNGFAAYVILLMEGCPLYKRVITVFLKFFLVQLPCRKTSRRILLIIFWCIVCTHLEFVSLFVVPSRLMFLVFCRRLSSVAIIWISVENFCSACPTVSSIFHSFFLGRGLPVPFDHNESTSGRYQIFFKSYGRYVH